MRAPKRPRLELRAETIAQLTADQLQLARGGRLCTDSCDTCPSLWLTCAGNTCTA